MTGCLSHPCWRAAGAVSAARAGKTVVLLEPGAHLGGMSSGGLSWTDVGNADRVWVVGGMAREFYERVGVRYGQTGAKLTFEPKIAESVFHEMLAEAGITPRWNQLLASVTKSGQRITEIAMEDGTIYRGDLDEPVANPERCDEMPRLCRQRHDRAPVQVIVVVVRQEHGVDRRQVRRGDRRPGHLGRAGHRRPDGGPAARGGALNRPSEVTARRDGRNLRVHSTELVPGDVVLLSAGSLVPADGSVIEVDLEAREATWEFTPGHETQVWGFNGQVPGPTIRASPRRHSTPRPS